jgi:hypothetical protein
MMLNTSSDIDEVVASFMLAIQDSTKAETQGSEMTTIYFDESGNTGRQLADLDQPLFILGSCDFNAEECEQLLRPLRSRQALEIHFKKLRKTGRGQDRVIELFRSGLVTPECSSPSSPTAESETLDKVALRSRNPCCPTQAPSFIPSSANHYVTLSAWAV